MISVGNRDANKGLGLVLGFGGGREMEEAELEEGEACSYNNNNNDGYDASIDPDIALSYIDEKLQHVLGHFQKDFEGGVSAENLGAKFGGYGSFLPTYQRSPAQSHLRSPPKVENHNAPSKSPNYLQYENGHHSSAVSSAAPPSLRPGPASSSTSVPALNAPSIDDSLKEEMSITSSGAEEYRSRHEYVNRRYLSDQKTLKVRIKVGSDNLSTQKNAEIYSGLGLDVSPSSSLDDSPSESEGMDREPQDAPIESPTSIIRVMTSIPVLESQLLSPLPDYLIHLIAKENLLKDSRSVPFSKAYLEATHSLLKGSDSRKGIEKIGGEKKRKSMEKRKFSKEFRSRNNRDARRGFGAIPREVDIDTSACEEIVAETLKLPLLSNSYSSAVDTRGTSKPSDTSLEPCKSAMRDTVSSLMKEESSRPVYTEESGWDENSKAGSTGKIWDRKKESSTDDVAVYPRKDGSCKRDKTLDSVKVDSHALVTRKAVVTELVDPPKQNSFLRVTSHESDGKLAHGKEHESAGIKRKSKGSQSLGDVAAELPKGSSKANSSSVSKNKKNAHEENYMNKKETENKLPKYVDEVEDRYREFFGDIESEQDGKKMIVLEMNSEDGPKQCEVVDKTASTVNNALKERSIGKRTGKFSAPEPYRKFVANGALPRGPGPMPDAAQGTTATVLIEENWVCCDKCQKWRLLPLGINPDSLPEKWLCSMLNWLPGMNRCSVSEEETTKALIALYQAPGPASQNNLQINPGCGLSSVTLADVRHPDQTRNFSSHALSHGRKKKQGLKEIPSANEDVNIQLPNSMKKNVQASVRSESLNGMCHSPLGRELDVRQLSKSSDFSAERHKDKQKEKRIMLEHNSDGGDTKSLKKKIKRDSDRDSIRASKKIKTEDLNVTGDDWMSAHGGVPEKRKPSSSNGLLTSLAGKEQSRHNDYSSKDSKSDTKDRPQTSAKKQKDKVKVPVDDATSKKRKLKESLDYQISSGSIPRSDNDIQGSRNFLEEFSENDYKKEKKARISKSEGKASSVSRGSGKSEKKGSRTKNWHLGQDVGSAFSLRSLDGLDSKRDPGLVHPPVAATSSSSKVSGSHKNKGSFHEAKGSPVESVSSSPMRTSARRNLNGKNESPDTELFCIGSPRKCPYDEDDGGFDRSGTIRKGKSIEAQHESLDLPVLDMQDKDFGVLSGGKAKSIVPSPEVENQHYRKPETAEPSLDDERRNDSRHHANGSCSRKSSKGSSSRSKDKNRISKSNYVCEVQDHMPSDEVKPRDGRSKFQEKSGVQLEEDDMRHVERKDSGGKCSENSKKEHQSSVGRHSGPDATCVRDATSTPKQSLLQDCSGERSSKGFVSDKTDQVELVCGKEKLQSLPHSGGVQNETLVRCPRPAHGSHKGNGSDILAADVSQVGEASKMTKLIRKADHQNGSQSISSRHPTAQNGHRARDAQSPARKDSSSQAANNALKEAKDLKHLADRLKNSGSNSEGTGLYFQAALKFLHGASLLESSGCDKQGEFSQSTTIYSSTAKLCEFCAHEYERSKDNAAAALAYKCMEVAYLRVIYSTHSTASRDRHELQTALQMAPPGESPSSSASDVDNVNHPTTVDKVALTKGVSSPQVPVNHVVAPRHRVKFSRLLTFAQDINFAMEASKKSRHAFALASANLGDGQQKDGISSIKRALDFNFQDVVGLLHLVRLAMEVISR